MNFDDFKSLPAPALGGVVDYQDPTLVLPGGALEVRNCKFTPDSVEQRPGLQRTIARHESAADVTGIAVLDVKGVSNPGQVPILFSSLGELLQESPAGSGCVVSLNPPFPLPVNAFMRPSKGENSMFMAFSDGKKGLCPPLQYVGAQRRVSAISQNTIGALWKKGTRYIIGDVVRSPDGRWWRCNVDATGPAGAQGPIWPDLYGYFTPGSLYVPSNVIDQASPSGPGGQSQWEEWTPNVANVLPAPDLANRGVLVGHNAGGGTIPAAKDVYVKLAWTIFNGESPRSQAVKFVNTVANDQVVVVFNGNVAGGGPRVQRWMAELNLRPALFFKFTLNVYVAAVTTGAPEPADAAYFMYSNATEPSAPLLINSIPVATAVTYTLPARILPNYVPEVSVFAGEGGRRYLMVLRQDREGSLVPVDPDSPIAVQMAGSLSLQITSITRNGAGLVSANVADVTSLAPGVAISVEGVADTSFNGAQTVTGVAISLFPAGVVLWQTATFSIANSTGGELRIGANYTPFAFLPPGNPNFDQLDIAAFSVVGADRAGPFFFIASANPKIASKASILSIVFDGKNALLQLDDVRGFSLGQDIRVTGITGLLAYLNQTTTIATINGNNITCALLGGAGNGPGNIGAQVVGIQTLPTTSPAAVRNMVSVSVDASGVATAPVDDIGGLAAGHRTHISGFDRSDLNGILKLLSATAVEGLGGTISWQAQPTAGTFSNQRAIVRGYPDIALNFSDAELANDVNVTRQLTSTPAPNAADVYFSQELRQAVYTTGMDSKFYFSRIGDPANIDVDAGLSINDNSETLAICLRELKSGEIFAIKEDGGYSVNPGELSPSQWATARRWTEHGPPCAAMVGVGPDFIVFASKAGAYLYKSGELEWLSKEYSKTWNRINWSFAHTGWVAVDDETKEIHFGVPLDGATTPNKVLRVSYYNAWNEQEQENRFGKLLTYRSARRWEMDDISAACASVVTRTLVAPIPCPGTTAFAFTAITRIANLVTATYASLGNLPPAAIAGLVSVKAPGHPSFNGVFAVTGRTIVPPTLTWVQAPFSPIPVRNLSWVNGSSGDGLAIVLLDGAPPTGIINVPAPGIPFADLIVGTFPQPAWYWIRVTYNSPAGESLPSDPFSFFLSEAGKGFVVNNSFVANTGATSYNVYMASGLPRPTMGAFRKVAANIPLLGKVNIPNYAPTTLIPFTISLLLQGTGTGLDNTPFDVSKITQQGAQYTVELSFPTLLADSFSQDDLGQAQFVKDTVDEIGAGGTSVLATLVEAPPNDHRVTTRQLVYGMRGAAAPWYGVSIYSANRQTGLRGDATIGGVVTFLFDGPLYGNNNIVIASGIEGFDGEDGVFDQPCTAAWGDDPAHPEKTKLQFKDDGPDLTRMSGMLYATQPVLRVSMAVPDRHDDEGIGMRQIYEPSFFGGGGQIAPPVLRFGGLRAEAAGAGAVKISITTENEDGIVAEYDSTLVAGVNQIEKPVRVDNQYATMIFDNKKAPGSWFSLRKLVMFANPLTWGKR